MDDQTHNQTVDAIDVNAEATPEVTAATPASELPSGLDLARSPSEPGVRSIALHYIEKGLRLVRLRPGTKHPHSNAWQNAQPKANDFRPNDNVGVLLGAKSGHLVDIDFDIAEARQLAGLDCFFGRLPSFGRSSLPKNEPGHRLVICRDAPDKVEKLGFSSAKETEAIAPLGLSKTVVLELRAGQGYTVFPPSALGEDRLVWGAETAIPEMPWVELRKRAGLLAFAAFAAACYPPEGNRDNFCLLLAGVLIHAGVDPQVAEEIIARIADIKGDNAEERKGKALKAAERHQAGEPVTGLPTFLEAIGMQALDKRLRGWLQMSESITDHGIAADIGADDGNVIYVNDTDIAERTRQIERGLIAADIGIYRLADRLMYPRKLEDDEIVDGVRRPKNLMRLCHASPDWLAIQASSASSRMTFLRKGPKGSFKVAPTAEIMRALEVTIADRHFPVIHGLVTTPTLTRNEPGYDSDARLYLGFEKGAFGEIPLAPTRADAEAALARLVEPAKFFPFATPSDKAVWLAAMLTAVVRGQLRSCPVVAFDAPAAGSGKTKLAQMVGLLGLGVLPPAGSWGENEEENSKTLFSILRAGDTVVLFDNVDEPIGNPDLCRALTAPTIMGRVLGVSEMVTLSTRTLIMFTGNNLQIAGDMTRRTIVCRLDAGAEHPEDRSFDFDPVKYVEDRRSQLVADALIVLRAYCTAGRPEGAKLATFNSFEDWNLVRGALVWLGEADPHLTTKGLRGSDTKSEEKAELFQALLSAYGVAHEFMARDLDNDSSSKLVGLKRTITRLTGRPEFNAKSAGKLLARYKQQPFMGVTLKSQLNGIKQRVWWFDGKPEKELRDACELDKDGKVIDDVPF